MKKSKKFSILFLIISISVLIAISCTNDNSSDEPNAETTPTAAAPEVDACADVVCDAGQICVNGACRVIKHNNGEACSCDDDCQSGYCDASTRQCKNRPCSDIGCDCSASHDCAEGLICQDGLCTRPTYTITYNLNNGSWKSGYTAQTSYEANSEVTLPDSSKVRRDYYRFLGWFENESDTEPVTSISNIDGNKSYIAKWEAYTSPAGMYLLPDGSTVACRAGTYSSANSRVCTACPEGTVSSAGASNCTQCAPGKYQNHGHTACE